MLYYLTFMFTFDIFKAKYFFDFILISIYCNIYLKFMMLFEKKKFSGISIFSNMLYVKLSFLNNYPI